MLMRIGSELQNKTGFDIAHNTDIVTEILMEQVFNSKRSVSTAQLSSKLLLQVYSQTETVNIIH
jgi:hypothetical protein